MQVLQHYIAHSVK